MVSNLAYKIIKKAVIIRVREGEDAYEVVASYTKLSSQQQEQMIAELIQEGIITPEPPVEEDEPQDETE